MALLLVVTGASVTALVVAPSMYAVPRTAVMRSPATDPVRSG